MKRTLCCCLFLLSSQAWSTSPSFPLTANHYYLNAGLGQAFYQVSGNNYLGTGAGWPDDFYHTNQINNQPYLAVSAIAAWDRNNEWIPSYGLGLRLMYGARATISGDIEQYSLPTLLNYHYDYGVTLFSTLLLGKATIYNWRGFLPFVLVGAGITNVHTCSYEEQALSGVTPRVSPGFNGDTSYNFTYQLGVGVDYQLNENTIVNVECDYLNYGTISTGHGNDYTTLTGTNYDNESLSNKLTTATLFVGLTYLIG